MKLPFRTVCTQSCLNASLDGWQVPTASGRSGNRERVSDSRYPLITRPPANPGATTPVPGTDSDDICLAHATETASSLACRLASMRARGTRGKAAARGGKPRGRQRFRLALGGVISLTPVMSRSRVCSLGHVGSRDQKVSEGTAAATGRMLEFVRQQYTETRESDD